MSEDGKTLELKGFDEVVALIGNMGDLADHLYWPLHDAMADSVALMEEQAKVNLLENGSVATGRLRSSIGSVVELSETAIIGRVGTSMGQASGDGRMGYARAVEFGSRPHMPPVQALIEWVRLKGLAGTYSLKTQRRLGSKADQQAEDLAVARRVQRAIARRGTRARPFLYPTLEQKKEEVVGLFRKAIEGVVGQIKRGGR